VINARPADVKLLLCANTVPLYMLTHPGPLMDSTVCNIKMPESLWC